MKQTNTFIVLRDKEGNYLASYKNSKHVLAYSAGWSSDVEDALKTPEEYYYGKDHEKYLAMAMLFDAEPIKVQAEYTLTTLDGQEPAEPVKDTEDVKDSFKKLLDILAKD
ncbi:hypothetical protein [Streptococcus suis]|uniref:Phage protein n=1 Tax=Streptococcus suis R61 TaxID=996306 RepID=A0AA87F9C6_STRSU|nr:hypothetical protein [Streptococcus suis]ANM47448.1 hypothetical protein [Streptococcus phage phiJH1301-1]ATZ02938.1 hypothetical protein CVO91_02660 [Streptococcus suis]EHC03019.1 hypothetical protein SSUR61_1017 [Streptococcus suis R61]MBY4981800.1 hypothetical protein [Streptococcus suis]MBY4992546.1 hypothetical protein [Streptococcus suis]